MKAMVRLHLDYTIFFGVGGYHLVPEKSMAIELDMITYDIAEAAALEIGILNNQEFVLVQEIPVLSQLIRIPHTVVLQSHPRAVGIKRLSVLNLFRRLVRIVSSGSFTANEIWRKNDGTTDT